MAGAGVGACGIVWLVLVWFSLSLVWYGSTDGQADGWTDGSLFPLFYLYTVSFFSSFYSFFFLVLSLLVG